MRRLWARESRWGGEGRGGARRRGGGREGGLANREPVQPLGGFLGSSPCRTRVFCRMHAYLHVRHPRSLGGVSGLPGRRKGPSSALWVLHAAAVTPLLCACVPQEVPSPLQGLAKDTPVMVGRGRACRYMHVACWLYPRARNAVFCRHQVPSAAKP